MLSPGSSSSHFAGCVDRVLGHHAIGGQLAAGDHHQPGHRRRDGVLAGDLRGGFGGALEQRSQAGVHALDVGVVERRTQQLVDVAEHVVDVGAGRRRVGEVEVPRGVRRTDDPVVAPRDHEQHRLLGLGDEAALAADAVAGYDEVDALARLDIERAATAEHLLDLVGPHSPGVDHDLRAHLDLAVVLEVHQPRADDPVALAQEADHLGARGHVGAVRRGGARDVHDQSGVVDLAVEVADRAGEVFGLQVGCHPGELPAEDVLVPGHTHLVLAGHRHAVVQHEPCADVRPLPGVVQRVEEGHRPHQVRRDPGEQQAAFLECFLDQAEVEHLQVAQSAVHQLRGPAARAAGEVALLDEGGGESARDRVQRRTRPDDACPHDQHVEVRAAGRPGSRHRVESLRARARSEVSCQAHAPSLSGRRCRVQPPRQSVLVHAPSLRP